MRGSAWPLIGRQADVEALSRALASGGAVLVGPAGVGKSRLAAETAGRMVAEAGPGAVPARVAGRLSARAIPLSPFAPLLPAGAGVLAPLDAPAVIEATLAERWQAPGDPVLVVDDAQWLDPVSVTVLHQLAAHHGVRLLVTARLGEPLAPEVVGLYAEELLDRIELAALDDAAVRELVLTVLDGPVEESTVANLVRVCAGNVLYLRELVLGSIEAGLLVTEHGMWRFTGSLVATPRLVEIVDARLAGFGEESRAALEVVAVAGALELPVLRTLADQAVVEALERAGLLDLRAGGPVPEAEIGHPLHAEVLRSDLPATVRQRIARELAVAAESGTPWDEARPDQRMQRALWHLEGGLPLDPRRLFGAAVESLDAGDQVLSARLATASFEADGAPDAVILASWCLAELGERDDAERLLLSARRLDGDPVDQAAIAVRLAEDRYWGRDDPDGAQAFVDEFLAGPFGSDAAAAALVHAHHGVFPLLSGAVAAGVAEAEPFVASPWPLVAMQAEVPRNLGAMLDGRCGQATTQAGSALERALTGTFPYLVNPGPHIVALGLSMLHDGNLAGAREIGDLIYAEAGRRTGCVDRAWAASVTGMVLMEGGRLRDAARRFVEAEALWRQTGILAFARVAAGLRVLVSAQCGEAATVDPGIDLDIEPRTMQFMEVYVARGRAWRDFAAGRRDAAVEAFVAATERGRVQGVRVLAAGAAHDLTRVGRADLAVTAFDRLGDFADAGLPRWLAAEAHALATNDLDALVAVAADLGDAGFELYAAEAEMEASRWARRRGRTRDAERLAARAAGRVAASGGAHTPLLEGARRAGPLSRREHEVARLAAEGRTNREIAEALVLSERTVENHLYRVFTKLGIASRDEIGAALDD